MLPVTKRPKLPRAENQRAVPDYLAREGLEHAENALEHLRGSSDPLLRFVPVVAATLAVCAGLSSLWGGRLAESMLLRGQYAVLNQTQASDSWNEYQADSLKAHVQVVAESLATDPALRRRLHSDELKYRARQQPLRKTALDYESKRTNELEVMDKAEAKKLDFDVATALFQISIVLASIAAMTKQPWLFFLGIVGGAIGIAFCVVGLVR